MCCWNNGRNGNSFVLPHLFSPRRRPETVKSNDDCTYHWYHWFLTGLQQRALLCVLTEAVLEVPTVVGVVQRARLRGRRRRLAVLPAERVRQVQVDVAAEGTVPRVPREVRAGVVR